MILVFITKHLLIYSSIIYGKNLLESTDTSASSNPSPGPCSGSNNKTDLAEVGSSSTTVLRLFKADSDGKSLEMVEGTDFEKKTDNDGDDKYTFKDGIKCTLVKCGNKDVWKKGDQGVNEPESVMYSPLGTIVVGDYERSVYYEKDDSGNWAVDTTDTTKQADGSGGTVTKSESTQPGEYTVSDTPAATTPTTETSSGTSIPESTQPGESTTPAEDTATVTTTESTKSGQDSGQSSGEVTSTTTPRSESSTPTPEIKLYKADSDGKSLEMVEGTDFVKKEITIDKYNVKANVKCISVKIGDKEKWKKGDQGVNEPRYVLHFVSDWEIILFGDPDNGTDATTGGSGEAGQTPTSTSPEASESSTDQSGTATGVSGPDGSGTHTGKRSGGSDPTSGGTTGTGGGTATATTVLKLFKTDSDGNPVEMVENTDFEKNKVAIDRYEFKENVKCISVKFGEKEIWNEGERGVYEPKYVLHFVKLGEIILFEDPDSGNEATDSGVTTGAHVKSADASSRSSSTPAKGGSSGSKTGVDLSLKAKKATDQFDHNKEGKIVTFTAKDNHAFKSVKTGDNLVWQTTNSKEYATKVILDGKNQKNKKVTIHLPNNTTKVFNREGKGNEWKEVIQPGEDTANVATTPGGKSGTDPTSGGGGTTTN